MRQYHLIRLAFGDPLTGAYQPGLAENSVLRCFPGAAALLKGKAFVKRGSRSLCLPLEGKVAERSEVG